MLKTMRFWVSIHNINVYGTLCRWSDRTHFHMEMTVRCQFVTRLPSPFPDKFVSLFCIRARVSTIAEALTWSSHTLQMQPQISSFKRESWLPVVGISVIKPYPSIVCIHFAFMHKKRIQVVVSFSPETGKLEFVPITELNWFDCVQTDIIKFSRFLH